MIALPRVVCSGHVDAGAEDIWEAVKSVEAMLDWYPSANHAEKLDGPDEGVGRVQRVRYKVGVRNAAIESQVVEWEEPSQITWIQVREFLGTKQAPMFARNITTSVSIEPDDDGCEVSVSTSWEPVGLKGELATETVIRPRAESLAGTMFDKVADRCGT